MILTDTGIDALNDSRDSLVSWLLKVTGLQYSSPTLAYHQNPSAKASTADRAMSKFQAGGGIPRNASDDIPDEDTLSPREQKARVVALRGLSQARDGEFDAARETFGDAIRLDPRLDLSRLPSFWNMPNQTHDAVIEALYDTERTRDAASLIADLRTRFRPRLLPNRDSR